MAKESKEALWHSTSHVLADAVKRLWPDVKLAIGPAIDEGFYYDFDKEEPFTPADLDKIEKEMKGIIEKNYEIKQVFVSRKEAEKILKEEPYKLELLKEIKDKKISFFEHGDFKDLCAGPHVRRTGEIKAFKLLKVSGSYWRGDSSKKQLQRIYGISFSSKQELDSYIKQKEEAEKRDHRKLGPELELFMISDLSLSGCPIFLPKGAVIYNELIAFLRSEYRKRGYQEVITPQVFKKELWEISGHWQHYRNNMFTFKINDRDYSLKPMNCPSHMLIYKSKMRSYRDLPLRLADFGVLHRNELGGVLGGLTRVVKFSQDDAHIYATPEQVSSEIEGIIDFIKYVYEKIFKFEYKMKLSTRPKEFMGDKKLWDDAEKSLASTLKKLGIKYDLQEGEGAFYGPKIDIIVKDSLGREWQVATVQLDFQLPLKFDATYEGSDGQKHHCVIIHRAILGSLERFIGLLIENYAGNFPLWLSPVQVKIMTLTEENIGYAKKIEQKLREKGIRLETDYRNSTIQSKVRDAQLEKVPYMLTVGEKEEKAGTLAVRTRDGKVKFGVKVDEFIAEIEKEILEKK